MGVNLPYLEFNVKNLNDTKKKLSIINQGGNSSFKLYSENSNLLIEPDRLYLNEGEEKTVNVRLRRVNSGFNSTLYILSDQKDSRKIKTGIRLPVYVKILNKSVFKDYSVEKRNIKGGKKTPPLTSFFMFNQIATNRIILTLIILAGLSIISFISWKKLKK